MFDTTIPQSMVARGDPVPNPTINVLVRTADKADSTNPSGQLGLMYEYARIMDNTAFVSKSSVAPMATARFSALVRKMFVAGSFDAVLQTLTYMQDTSFIGWVADPTMKARFLINSASKVYTLLPNLQSSLDSYLADVETVYGPTNQIVDAIRTGAKNQPMIRTALVFQQPSLYESAQEAIFLYHCVYLLCKSLNGFVYLAEQEPASRNHIALSNLKETTRLLTERFYKVATAVARLWNAALSAAYDADAPSGQIVGQNLNAIVFMFERGTQDKFVDYSALILRQFRRITDRRTPNWLSTQMVARPVSADSIRYDASTVQQATLDLKTLAYSREV